MISRERRELIGREKAQNTQNQKMPTTFGRFLSCDFCDFSRLKISSFRQRIFEDISSAFFVAG